MKKHFWKLEYSITLFALLAVILTFVPFNFENYLQVQSTNNWIKQYGRLSYIFSALKVQKLEQSAIDLDIFAQKGENQEILREFIEPYLGANSIAPKNVKKYEPHFLNGTKVSQGNYYFFDTFYTSKRGIFLGIKNTPKNVHTKSVLMVMVDLNGVLRPNVWGRDIYGIEVYSNGEIRPFGDQKDINVLNGDCSKNGTGVYCSALYLIGGEMDE